eukprot:m.188236 g.188236  ORF g.188236 m.188236 type:complete len:587 (-) comp17345_c0_seq1:41-1801(-)
MRERSMTHVRENGHTDSTPSDVNRTSHRMHTDVHSTSHHVHADVDSNDSVPDFPLFQVASAAVCNFAQAFGSIVIFPYMPFLVQHFYPELTREELGARVGLLGSAFFAGQLCSSTLWGKVSDVYGRKPTLLLGLIGTIVTCLAFGLAPTYQFALAARFGWGFLNGNTGVAKAYLADVCAPEHAARGFAMLGFASGLGRLLGPSVGARLADEVWFPNQPFLVPCIAVAVLQVSIMVFVAVHMHGGVPGETVKVTAAAAVDRDRNGTELIPLHRKTSEVNREGATPTTTPMHRHKHNSTHDTLAPSFGKTSPPPNEETLLPPRSMLELLQDGHVVAACLLYASLGFATTITRELIALWPILPPARGGFCFSSSMIGRVIVFHAMIVLVVQAWVFHRIANRYGYIRVEKVGTIIFAVATVVLPYTGTGLGLHGASAWRTAVSSMGSLLGSDEGHASAVTDCDVPDGALPYHIGWVTWGAMAVVSGIQSCVQVMLFTSSFVLISNSCYPQERGVVNGGAQTLVALTRMLAPIVGGAVFQWSVSSETPRSWPFNVHFTFLISALSIMMTWTCAQLLPPTANKPRRRSAVQS